MGEVHSAWELHLFRNCRNLEGYLQGVSLQVSLKQNLHDTPQFNTMASKHSSSLQNHKLVLYYIESTSHTAERGALQRASLQCIRELCAFQWVKQCFSKKYSPTDIQQRELLSDYLSWIKFDKTPLCSLSCQSCDWLRKRHMMHFLSIVAITQKDIAKVCSTFA